jgi:membrane-bound lytic murein transglycosylase B
MIDRPAADASPVRLRRASSRPGLLLVLLLGVLMAASGLVAPSPGADVLDGTATTTTTSAPGGDPGSTTTTTSPTGASSTTTTTTAAVRLPGGSSTTTTAAAADAEPLPPATPGPPPSEAELPPPLPDAPAPVAPPGANDAGRIRALAELRATETALKKARATEKVLAKKLLPFGKRLSERKAWMDNLDAQDQAAAAELADAKAKVRRMAIAGYVRGGDTQPVDFLLQATDPIDLERRRTIVEVATEARHRAIHTYAAAQRGTSTKLEQAVAAVDEAQAAYDVVAAELDEASAIANLLAFQVEEKRNLLDYATASALVGTTDIPRLVYDAYRSAAVALAQRAPQCRVPWTAIAAIGKIESNHGRYAGSLFALNGDIYPRILGIRLDGTRSALIADTDGGLLDTDTEFDRAVGPMQFIPSTWVRIAEDGNGDGVRDPNNIYDAALGTAAYLCRAVPSGGLDLDENLRPAIFSYNHSDAYVDAVLTWHQTYAAPPA